MSGMPSFSEYLRKRHAIWWSGTETFWQQPLPEKAAGRRFAESMGVKTPDLYWIGTDPEAMPSFDALPPRILIKPGNGWTCRNVFCVVDGRDTLDHRPLTRESIVESLAADNAARGRTPNILIEELLRPEPGQVGGLLPMDFKFFCFGEEIACIHGDWRHSLVDRRRNRHFFIDVGFNPLPEPVLRTQGGLVDPGQPPDCWEEMLECVRRLGKQLDTFMRIDMYPTDKGAVFGEFEPTPNNGTLFSPWGDRFLARYMAKHGLSGVV